MDDRQWVQAELLGIFCGQGADFIVGHRAIIETEQAVDH